MVNWNIFNFSYNLAYENFKASVGAEIIEQLLSIPDTIAFIEFIYEEAAQTLLFAVYNAYKTGQYDMADEIIKYIKHELLPDATGMVGTWGALNPATLTAFQRFFDAVELSVQMWEQALKPKPLGYGTLVIYTDERNVRIEIDGEFKGYANPDTPLKVKLSEGEHEVIAKKEGYQVEVRHPRIKDNEVRTIKIDMRKLPED